MEVTKHGSIVRLDGIVSSAELTYLLEWISKNEGRFERSAVFSDLSATQTVQDGRASHSLTIRKDVDEVDPILYGIFGRAFKAYQESLPQLSIRVKDDEGYQVVRYLGSENGFYDVHVDDHTEQTRRVSGLLYLNSGYEGGDLRFPLHDVTIRPQAGTIVMFPSGFEYPHASLPVTRGEKLAVTTWFY